MDAFNALLRLLREMSLGVLFFLAAVALLLASPALYVAWKAWTALRRHKGDETNDCLYGRQPHRGGVPVVN